MDKLKPCPFCGGKAKPLFGDIYLVACEECRSESNVFTDPESAIKAWNKRTYVMGLDVAEGKDMTAYYLHKGDKK